MAKNIFEMSKNGKSEYCINVVKIGTLTPIEGSDFLAQTFIGDASIVVRKDQVKEGDLLFYASNECQLNEKFLSVNNLFEIGCYEKNSNASKVRELLEAVEEFNNKIAEESNENNSFILMSKRDECKVKAKSMCGFFSHNGRVRMIRLKKVPSMGYLFSLDEMAKYCPKVKGINLEDYLNKDFDTVDGELFVKAYVPPINVNKGKGDEKNRRNKKKVKRFDRMIEGEFYHHYDTAQLSKNMWQFSPTDNVVISNKLHGTSGVFANIKIKNPIKIALYKRLWNKIVDTFGILKNHRFIDYTIVYDNIYSSRSIIKNQYINKNVSSGYYKFDIWKEANDVLKPFIDKGMTVYAEICGYADKTPIQKGYDYGCKEGEFFVMPYRIVTKHYDKRYEWNVGDVKDWTNHIINEHPELSKKIHPITIFYNGTLGDLYPNIPTTEYWNEMVLKTMMTDKEHFGMEELEPMCKNKVPREGIVIRKNNDPISEAFKLKCIAFKEREAKAIDKGEVDIEMQDTYYDNNTEITV